MTLYRDDIQETITYSNTTLSKTKGISEEIIRLREDSLHRLFVYSDDSIGVVDEVLDSAIFPIKEMTSVSDSLNDRKFCQDFIYDEIIISDGYKTRLRAKSLVYDQINSSTLQHDRLQANSLELLAISDVFKTKQFSIVTLSETVTFKESYLSKAIFKDFIQENIDIAEALSRQSVRSYISEIIEFQEQYKLKKITKSVIDETIRVSDKTLARYSDRIDEHVNSSDLYHQRMRAKQNIIDSLTTIETIKQLRKVKQWIHENITHTEFNHGKNIAKQTINDLIFVEETESIHRSYGYAWTANVDTWAMSRYQDYGYSELTVIDGVLYGVADDGIYRLDADVFIEGKVITGQLDIGQGSLVHPMGAYLEYELAGESKLLSVGVTTTQSGMKQTYFYNLPKEPSNYLTNGRVQFGRGLRGRHFSFEIKVGGLYGYINDFSIDIAGTKRRI